MDLQRLLAILVAALALPGAFGVAGRGGGTSVGTIATHTASSDVATLTDARLDAARVAGVDPRSVTLLAIQPTTWDGCLGVKRPGQACAMLAVPGFIARFEAGGRTYRYHLAGDRYLGPIDPALAEDGSTTSQPSTAESEALLAYYARADLALREAVEPSDITVEAAVPSLPCKPAAGSRPTNCPAETPAQATFILSVHGENYAYGIVPEGASRRLDRLTGVPGGESSIRSLQQGMREDLAERLHIPDSRVSVLAYIPVQWPDACLGIEESGQICAQAITPGFDAILLAPAGNGQPDKLYTYRGAGNRFVAADFVPGATIEPAPSVAP
ncbi:MAG TPA: hypothetical protein VJQ83_06900 [Tepidiformaceae bacterium]|nr:hypothetical protein [Tepidiformaceae bacterium]